MKRSLRMREFKVGDKVRSLVDELDIRKGAEYTVTEGESYGCIAVLDDREDQHDLRCTDVEHVEATPIPKDFRFFRRSDGAISQSPYPTFEAALEGWRGFAQNGDQTEIVELISHGTYKATLKVEIVEPITEGA
jgi:hypothetical protein